MTQPERTVMTSDPIPFGGGELFIRSLTATPYLVIVDRGNGPVLALAVGPDGFVIHPAHDVKIGDVLEPQIDPHEVRR